MDSLNVSDLNTAPSGEVKPKKVLNEKTKRIIFYILMISPFLAQAAIFYIYVNFSNVMLAFSKYTYVPGVGSVGKFSWFENFEEVLTILFSQKNVHMFSVSFLMYAIIAFVATPVSIIFSFYVYKKFPLSEFFRIILFFPQIISTVVMTMTFRYLVNDVYTFLSGAKGLLDKMNETSIILPTLIFYNLWMGFGANILLASGAMSGINESIVESCHLDGCNTVQEFIYITLPSIYPTIVTFVVIDLAAVFSNQMNLYTFFQIDAPQDIWSVGYYIYLQTAKSQGLAEYGGSNGYLLYPQISAIGVMITLVVLPVTLTVRRLLEKFGPSVN
ncbi:MAG: sugar ABC transporter permease [Clostridiales bacterium]|nr:sugar ABC transporter permease [Clostridiales bacterium]